MRATDDIREFLSDLVDNLIPHDHPVSHRVTLRHVCQHLSRSSARQLESVSSNTADTGSSKDSDFSTDLVITSSVRSATMTGISVMSTLSRSKRLVDSLSL
jgi:hypothetical protein